MEKDTCELVIKITLSSGVKRSHSYPGCPVTEAPFNQWWDKQMGDVFIKTGLRHWLKLKNPDVFYHIDHIASWEFEHNSSEEFGAILDNKTSFMLSIVGPG